MGSIVPFQDLNLLPSPPQSTFNTPMNHTLLTPKTEPTDQPTQFFHFPNNHTIESVDQNRLIAYQNHQSTPESLFSSGSTSTVIPFYSDAEMTPVAAQQESPASDQDNLFSEYTRISELFRSAFERRIHNHLVEAEATLDSNTGAIVAVNDDDKQLSTHRKKYEKRSTELVRVTNLSSDDTSYFRDIVRKTRMLFAALRIMSIYEDDKRRELSSGFASVRRGRGDLTAAALMRDNGLWLNREKRIVGPIPGVEIGDLFLFRMELCVVGLHGQAQAGIDYCTGNDNTGRHPIATSIIVSGGYEDDEDSGDVIVYTGHGGQDKFNRQCEHQKLEGGNLAMQMSMHYGIEIRVIRGIKKYHGSVSNKIYVYDGLYKILECWFDVGKSGFGVYKFRLARMEGQPEMGSTFLKFADALRTRPLSVRPAGYLSLDLSGGLEAVPVFVFNDIDTDQEPLYYEYAARPAFPPYLYTQRASSIGCDCVMGCTYGCHCAFKNGGDFAYDMNGSLLRGKPVVFECGPYCQCPPNCRNRVSQKGLRHRLEVFRSIETGWALRTLDLINAGDFIIEYTGVALTMDQAQILGMSGERLVYPSQFKEKWKDWGNLSQVLRDYKPPSQPSIPPLDFAFDVSRSRNAACYISHSSVPNVMVQLVLYDHNNLMFPHIMLFALECIPPMQQLSLDYGVPTERNGKPLAICN